MITEFKHLLIFYQVEVEIAREEDPFNLKCGNCNVVLPSFKEYKDHAELCQQEPMDEPQAKRRNIMSTERKNKSLLG